jgi:hypothetical protein
MELDQIYDMDCLEEIKALPDGSYDKVITMKVNYCEEDGDRVRYNPTPRNIRYKIKQRQVSKESRTSNENRN